MQKEIFKRCIAMVIGFLLTFQLALSWGNIYIVKINNLLTDKSRNSEYDPNNIVSNNDIIDDSKEYINIDNSLDLINKDNSKVELGESDNFSDEALNIKDNISLDNSDNTNLDSSNEVTEDIKEKENSELDLENEFQDEYIDDAIVASATDIINNLRVDKTVVEIKDEYGNLTGEYEVSLNINKSGTDIIFAIDNSYSYGRNNKGKWNEIITYIKKTCQKLLDTTDNNGLKRYVRIGIIAFSGTNRGAGNIEDAIMVSDFRNDINEIDTALKLVNKFGDSNSNTYVDPLNIEAALLKAKEMLKSSGNSKYVILYTDGPPTQGIGLDFSNKTGVNDSIYKQYEQSIFNVRDLLSKENIKILAAGEKDSNSTFLYNDFRDINRLEKNMINTLKGISTIDMSLSSAGKYEEKFFCSSFDDLRKRDVIEQQISSNIKHNIINDKLIYDIKGINVISNISNDFEIVNNSYGEGKSSLVIQGNNYNNINCIINKTSNSLRWEDLDVDDYGLVIKYRIKPIDDYLIKDNALYNDISKIEINNNSETVYKYFENPILNVRKTGTITVGADFYNNKNEIESEINDFDVEIENIETKECIKLIGNSGNDKEYSFTLVRNGKLSSSKDFLVAGKYKINSITIPDGYRIQYVNIDGNARIPFNDNSENYGQFIINKDNPNVSINIRCIELDKVIEGKVYIENNINKNNLKLNFNASEMNLTLNNAYSDEKYSFNIEFNSILEKDICIFNDDYKVLDKKNLLYVREGKYKIKEILPMNINLDSIEIKYDKDDSWKNFSIDDAIEISEDNSEIYIRLNHNISNNKYWYKRVKGK